MCTHVCKPNVYKNQGRCSICGRFMPSGSVLLQSVNNEKEEMLEDLRNGVYFIEYEKDGDKLSGQFTLMPEYLSDYVGKGSSKKANPDTIFAFEVNDLRFKAININTVETFELD